MHFNARLSISNRYLYINIIIFKDLHEKILVGTEEFGDLLMSHQ